MANSHNNDSRPDSKGLTRRNLLRALPVVGVALSLPNIALSDGISRSETPVATLFKEWMAAKTYEDTVIETSDDTDLHDAVWEARYDVEKRLMVAPCETARDWLFKMAAWSNFGVNGGPDYKDQPQLWNEARALTGGAV